MAKTPREPEETFYHVQLIDAELGKIRFGPFTAAQTWKTPELIAENLRKVMEADYPDGGLEVALSQIEIFGGLRVFLTGDDGTRILITEVPSP